MNSHVIFKEGNLIKTSGAIRSTRPSCSIHVPLPENSSIPAEVSLKISKLLICLLRRNRYPVHTVEPKYI